MGKHDEAIKAFDKALELNPNDEATWNDRGLALEAIGKYDEAKQAYSKAMELNPYFAWPLSNMDGIFYSQKRYSEAPQFFEKALKLEPQDGRIWYNKGAALESLGRKQEADALCQSQRVGVFNGP